MFYGAISFNQELTNWTLNDNVVIQDIFTGATSFNNGYDDTDTDHPLGDGWNPVANYSSSFRDNGCPLTDENASPLI
jgi:hypothetical protein